MGLPFLRGPQTSLQVSSFPRCAAVKNLPADAGDARDAGSILGSGRFLGVGNGNPLQYSYLGNPMDRGAWRTTVHGVKKESDTTGVTVHTHTHTHTHIPHHTQRFLAAEGCAGVETQFSTVPSSGREKQ